MRKLTGHKLLVATHNAGKLQEMRHILAPFEINVSGAADHKLVEPDETETTFVGNARIKAHAATQATGFPALSDDSGIEIAALNGAPGVYTADWAETPNGRDFELAMKKAHQMLVDQGHQQPWNARFCSTLVLAWPDGEDLVFEGTVEGRFVWPMRGRTGHGYDPIFQPNGYKKTFAEMTDEQKNSISHRAIAMEKFIGSCFDR